LPALDSRDGWLVGRVEHLDWIHVFLDAVFNVRPGEITSRLRREGGVTSFLALSRR
jgi:hypothetical protein